MCLSVSLLIAASAKTRSQTAANLPPPPSIPMPRRYPQLWSPYITLTNEFNSNISNVSNNSPSYGVVFGLGAFYHFPRLKPNFELNYEAGIHFHTGASRFNRVSHYFNASYEQRINHRWRMRTVGLISLNGPTEIHELADQYILLQGFIYHLTKRNKLHIYAAYRKVRYPGYPLLSAVSPYYGLKYVQVLGNRCRWDMGYRFGTNYSKGFNDRYIRNSYSADYVAPLNSKTKGTIGIRYEPERFERLVKVVKAHVHRRDQRVFLLGSLIRHLRPNLDMRLNYRYETRFSNVRHAEFNSHQISVTLQYLF